MLFLFRPCKELIISLRFAALAIAAAVVLGGCSAPRFIYNQGPELAYWWLDGYADFDDEQAPRARSALASWFRWHRSTQLGDYAILLERAQADVLADTTPSRVCEWIDTVRDRFETAYEHAIPPLVDIAVGFTPAQIAHVERRYAKANSEFRDDFLQDTREERLEASIARSTKRASKLYGKLDAAQREFIAHRLAASPFDADLWYAERQARQQDVINALKDLQAATKGSFQATGTASPTPVAQARVAFLGIGKHLRRSPRDAYQAYEDRFVQYNCEFMAQLHNSTSPAQRQTAAARLRSWEEDLRALSGTAER